MNTMLAFYHGGGIGGFVGHAVAWDLIGESVRAVTHGMSMINMLVLTCALLAIMYFAMWL